MSLRLSYEHVRNFCYERNINLLSEEYKNSYNQKLYLLCCKCGDIWKAKFNDIYNGHGCPKCAGVKKLTYEYVKNFCEENGIFLLSEEYKNSCRDKLIFKCKTCKNIWKAMFSKIHFGQRCPNCRIDRFKKTNLKKYGVEFPAQNREIASKAAKKVNNSYILKHWKTKEEIVCVASYEKAVVEYFNKNKIDFEWQISFKIPSGKTYFIDAFLKEDDIYVEIKGYFRKDAKEKWNWFNKEYPNSELWDAKKLKKMGLLKNS